MTSHHGLVCAMSVETGKILDSHVMTNHCVLCSKWEGKDKDSEEYMDFYAEHFLDCHKNHDGSAGSMETAGSLHLYEQSEDTRNIRYNPYTCIGMTDFFLSFFW